MNNGGLMELKKLYDIQEELDEYILSQNDTNISENQLLTSTLLALIVEVSEFANATRCFKHWSKKGRASKEHLLEEYVDIFHFFLSIGNQLGFSAKEVEKAYKIKNGINYERQRNGY